MGGFEQFYFDEVSARLLARSHTTQALTRSSKRLGSGAWASGERHRSFGKSSSVGLAVGGRTCDERHRW